jgi:hypothetical protein
MLNVFFLRLFSLSLDALENPHSVASEECKLEGNREGETKRRVMMFESK